MKIKERKKEIINSEIKVNSKNISEPKNAFENEDLDWKMTNVIDGRWYPSQGYLSFTSWYNFSLSGWMTNEEGSQHIVTAKMELVLLQDMEYGKLNPAVHSWAIQS